MNPELTNVNHDRRMALMSRKIGGIKTRVSSGTNMIKLKRRKTNPFRCQEIPNKIVVMEATVPILHNSL